MGKPNIPKDLGGQTGFHRDPFECGGSNRNGFPDFKSGGLNSGSCIHIVEKRVNSISFLFR